MVEVIRPNAPGAGAMLASGSDTLFGVVFGVFVVALLVLFVIVIVWAVRRDRAARADWARRYREGPRVDGPGSDHQIGGADR